MCWRLEGDITTTTTTAILTILTNDTAIYSYYQAPKIEGPPEFLHSGLQFPKLGGTQKNNIGSEYSGGYINRVRP